MKVYLTVDEVKAFKGKAVAELEDDAITQYIELYQEVIEEYCNTKFEPTAYTQRFELMSLVRVSKTPLIRVNTCKIRDVELVEDKEYFADIEGNSICVEYKAECSSLGKKMLSVEYMYGYEKCPATVKEVLLDLIQAALSNNNKEDASIESETFDQEYSYKNKDISKMKSSILARLDGYVQEEYIPTVTRQVRAFYV